MDLNNWYAKALEPEDYTKSLEKHKENFHKIYNEFELPKDEVFFKKLEEKNLRVIVLGEVWCGHCMLDIPILLRLAEKVNLPVRFLLRDDNLELMEQYLTNEKRIIPIFIFIDENGNEVAKWGPIADYVRQYTEQYRNDLPTKDSPEYDEAFQKMIAKTGKAFSENTKLWDAVYQELKTLLTK